MSRSFLGIIPQVYHDGLFGLPIQLGLSKQAQPKVVTVTIPWRSYGASTANPNIGVTVNLTVQGVVNRLDRILSVYIDNNQNDTPVYVQFPDTLFTVSCPPNSELWIPVVTSLQIATIFGEGFTNAQSPITSIYFFNVNANPFVNQEIPSTVALWKASASISRGNTILNQNYGVPALGDQFQLATLDVNATGQTIALFGTPLASGFIYITNLFISIANYSGDGVSSYANRFFFESTGAAGQFMTQALSGSGTQIVLLGTLLNTACQWKIDATQAWRVRNQVLFGPPVGALIYNFTYTTNPS